MSTRQYAHLCNFIKYVNKHLKICAFANVYANDDKNYTLE